jgi:hypothetical protein
MSSNAVFDCCCLVMLACPSFHRPSTPPLMSPRLPSWLQSSGRRCLRLRRPR